MTAPVLTERTLPLLWELALGGTEYVDYVNIAAELAASSTSYQDVSDDGDITLRAAEGTIFCSSSSASDTDNILLTYMDDGYVVRTVQQTLAGQAETQMGTVTDVFRCLKVESVDFEPLGDVYVYETGGTVTAGVPQDADDKKLKMQIGFNRSLSSVQAIPAGKTGLLPLGFRLGAGSSSGMSARLVELVGVLNIPQTILAPSGLARADSGFVVPIPITEKTDFKLQAKHDQGSAVQMSGTVPIVLVPRV